MKYNDFQSKVFIMYLFTISKNLTKKIYTRFLATIKYLRSEKDEENGKSLQNAKTNARVKEIETFMKG